MSASSTLLFGWHQAGWHSVGQSIQCLHPCMSPPCISHRHCQLADSGLAFLHIQCYSNYVTGMGLGLPFVMPAHRCLCTFQCLRWHCAPQ